MAASDQLIRLAGEGRLYPSLILYGGKPQDRLALAYDLGRTLLCSGMIRPCDDLVDLLLGGCVE
ncbi:MAG: hypothetical protein OXH70_17250 [Acidobacteria bacterium]|nr:hypothetical protein [Acidobacteriota bacterium]